MSPHGVNVITVTLSNTITIFFSSRRRHTRLQGDWSSDVCSSDLIQHGHAEDAAAAQVSICTVDLRDDRQADQGQIRDQALSPIDRPPAGAIRAVLSEAALSGAGARRGARQTMAEEGISGDQSPCLEGEGGDLFRRRRPCALGPPCRTDL